MPKHKRPHSHKSSSGEGVSDSASRTTLISSKSTESHTASLASQEPSGWTAFPLHVAVWRNDLTLLKQLITQIQERRLGGVERTYSASSQENIADLPADVDLESVDPRGRTALLLAVCLDHYECAKMLLEHGASAGVRLRYMAPLGTEELADEPPETFNAWSAVHEATCTGDVQLLSLVLQHRDAERQKVLSNLDEKLLEGLRSVPDFYVEMKWEFASWIPFVARLCPSDTCRIYKKGASVRLDTTLVGFENMSWIRGLRSFLFTEKDGQMSFHEIDHDAKVVRTESSRLGAEGTEGTGRPMTAPSEAVLAQRMRTPVMLTTLDPKKIQFDRVRSGLLWRSDKSEMVSGYNCKVFAASNVTFVTRSRTEHLSDKDIKKLRDQAANHPLNGIISSVRENENNVEQEGSAAMPAMDSGGITMEEYFDTRVSLDERDIGRPKQMSKRSKTFRANMWLCDDYPLSLRQQVLPIIDMMAATNIHFAKLRDFISLHLPTGFPVKIEIPFFHVITVRITFDNIFGASQPVDNVMFAEGENEAEATCDIADAVFEIPADYEISAEEGWWQDDLLFDDDPEMDGEFSDALPGELAFSESQMQELSQALQNGSEHEMNGFREGQRQNRPKSAQTKGETEQDIDAALRLSEKEMTERKKREEEETVQLEEALRRSLEER
ncbi:ankyrin repeat domain-containing protein 13A-like [Paramacrobiotus metropolitanus]|uniref:ankyrin repeat domain-containing protein 13A-like n=1 Tax=Paramacrobiotus metropolitanus TaxID=2943436 RepID=UPI00244634DD|nr:ankyrin repeat domain-containing protein 13A-like [Paramacrobiotus metropolitanus]